MRIDYLMYFTVAKTVTTDGLLDIILATACTLLKSSDYLMWLMLARSLALPLQPILRSPDEGRSTL